MAKYKVRFNPRIQMQLAQHAEFIVRISKPAALNFRAEFFDILHRLEENPLQFPCFDDPNLPPDTYRKAIFAKWYKAVFSIENETVYVEVIVDGRANNQFN